MDHLYYGLRLAPPQPRPPEILAATASQIDAGWLPVPLSTDPVDAFVLPASPSEVKAHWLPVVLSVAGPTSDTIPAAASEIDAGWLSVPLTAAEATTAFLANGASQIDAGWLPVALVAVGPTDAVIPAAASEILATWAAVPIIAMGGSGAACISGGSYIEAPGFASRSVKNFAISGWFRLDASGSYALVSKWDFVAFTEWSVLVTATLFEFSIGTNGSIEAVQHSGPSGLGFVAEKWYFFYGQRTGLDMEVWVGDVASAPTLGQRKAISGVTNITPTTVLFGASRLNGSVTSQLQGRLDSISWWQDQPTMTPAEIWAIEAYGLLSVAQKVNLGSWWDFNEENGLPAVWVDSHFSFDLDSKPFNGVSSCGGRPTTTPQDFRMLATASEIDAGWLAAGLTIEAVTDVVLPATPSQIDARWLAVPLQGATVSDHVLGAEASQIDAGWFDVAITTDSTTDATLPAAPSKIDAGWIAVSMSVAEPTAFAMSATPSQINAGWLNVALFVDTIAEATMSATPSEIDAGWLGVALNVAGPTNFVMDATASGIDAGWLPVPISVGQPTSVQLPTTPSEIDAGWLAITLQTDPPADVVLPALPSEIEAHWLPVALNTGNPSACFTDSNFSYMSRDILAKTGSLGFEQGTLEGHLSFWTLNLNTPTSPNPGFVFSGASGTGSGPRLQMGFLESGGGATHIFFESDNGLLALPSDGTVTAESDDLTLLSGWNHHLLGFDLSRTSEANGGWVYWLNGVEQTVTFGGTDFQQGRWFGDSQPTANELFRFLTVTVSFDSGIPGDSLEVCLDEMVLRPFAPTQAWADFYYVSAGKGTLITETNLTPGPKDYAWRITDAGATFGDEWWGDDSAGRDTAGFFAVIGATPLTPGIERRGNASTPPG